MGSHALPIPSATGSLDTYIQSVNRFPLLSPHEESLLPTAGAAQMLEAKPS